jgi:regulator of vacuolar morphogenesis
VDQAYVAPKDDMNTDKPGPSSAKPNELYPDTQTSYYNLLRHRFLLLRSTLRCSPPAEAINALDDDHPISLPRNAVAAHKAWRRLLVTVDPQMVQLACMDMESVLEVLEILARMVSDVVRSEDTQRVRRIGAWAWGLLGKCWEVGQLSTQEVGIIRNLGKRAATILQKVQELESKLSQEEADWSVSEEEKTDTSAEAQQESTGQDEKEATQGALEVMEPQCSSMPDASPEQSELGAAKARLQARLQGAADTVETSANSDYEGYEDYEEDYEEPTKQTHVLLDMIITVVGEFFGQRDLLETREVWV